MTHPSLLFRFGKMLYAARSATKLLKKRMRDIGIRGLDYSAATSSQIQRYPFDQEIEQHPDPGRHMTARADKDRMDILNVTGISVFQQRQ